MRTCGWKHFCLVMKNRPGSLARLTGLLTREAVSVDGMTIASVGDKAAVQFLAPAGCNLRRALRGGGFRPVESQVVRRTSSGRPRQLHRLVRTLGERGQSLLSFYGATGAKDGRLLLKSASAQAPRRR